MTHKSKMFVAITVIFMAVILIGWGTASLFATDQEQQEEVSQVSPSFSRNPLNGYKQEELPPFAIAVMYDNAYDVPMQYGLEKADIVYEALAEGNITRLMAIFDGSIYELDKIGPIRSARNYFMDWSEEYGGVYMHVGGSNYALDVIDSYDFVNIDQIGAGEVYFWRDNNLDAPHNVFTSDSNWQRIREMKEIPQMEDSIAWNYVDFPEEYPPERSYLPPNFKVDFSVEGYDIEWKFNSNLNLYQRWRASDKDIYDTGEQIAVKNIIVQVVDSRIIDDLVRREMDTKAEGKVFIFNPIGQQEGVWEFKDGRTRFYDEFDEELELVPGKTWVSIVPSEENLVF